MGTIEFQPLPADPLLGLMSAFREDQRAEKVDLGVGGEDAFETLLPPQDGGRRVAVCNAPQGHRISLGLQILQGRGLNPDSRRI